MISGLRILTGQITYVAIARVDEGKEESEEEEEEEQEAKEGEAK